MFTLKSNGEIIQLLEDTKADKNTCSFKTICQNCPKLNEMRKSGKLCDFTLLSEQIGVEIKVHKAVLAASSSYFESLFESKMVETEKKSCEFKTIHLENEFENIIEYLYTGQISFPFSELEFYYEHANYYFLTSLADFCVSKLIENIRLETCLDIWRIGVKFDNKLVIADSMKYIFQNINTLFNNESLMDMTNTELNSILRSNCLCCSEDEICSFIVKWVEYDYTNRKEYLDEFVKEIRFNCMTDGALEKVLSLKLFIENKEFSKMLMDILMLHLCSPITKFHKSNTPRVGFKEKQLVIAREKGLYHQSFDENEKNFKLPLNLKYNWKSVCVRAAKFCENYLLLTSDGVDCAYNRPGVDNNFRPFASISKIRNGGHGIATVHNQIYYCGGCDNSKSVELINLERGVWIDGIPMNSERKNFGITTWENCIYVMGGCKNNNEIIERYDPREGKWSYNQALPYYFGLCYMNAITFNDCLYGFNNLSGIVFDVRANKWWEKFIKYPQLDSNNLDCFDNFDVVEDMGIAHIITGKLAYWIYNIKADSWKKVGEHNNVSRDAFGNPILPTTKWSISMSIFP